MTRAAAVVAVGALTALAVAAPRAAAGECGAGLDVGYDVTHLVARYGIDIAACGGVPGAGTVTVRVVVERRDIAGALTGYASRTARCRAGSRSCAVRVALGHPAAEKATYEVRATYESTGDVVLAGSNTTRTWCTAAGPVATCALPV